MAEMFTEAQVASVDPWFQGVEDLVSKALASRDLPNTAAIFCPGGGSPTR